MTHHINQSINQVFLVLIDSFFHSHLFANN